MPQHRRARKRLMSEINVVPYIDVMLVLLIIFMITAPLLSQGVKIDLPRVPAEPLQDQSQEPLIVDVDTAGAFYLNYGDTRDQPIDPDTLVNRVRGLLRFRPGIAVLVRGDESASYGQVVMAMALLQRAGVTSVGLMTDPPKSNP